ncbi:unnamed protein product [Rotaria magnacalcarata]|nr:unnamed protein product [Rotaria magnacalcarata]
MRSSLIILLCLVIVMVNAASTTTTRRRVANATRPSTTKAPVPKSVYAYLRSVRGKNSCAEGSCPFWKRHGRSFSALRCYAQQYRECTCLHRMCFSSCMFTRQVCNQEMVSCLRQICPRCMPASASAMCAVYDSMAERVAEALSVFACYPCCPIINSGTNNNTNINSIIITTNIAVPATSTALPFNGFNGQVVTDPSGLDNFDDGGNFGNEYPSGTGEEINSGLNSNINYFPVNNGNNGVSNTGNAASNGNFNTFPGSNGGSNGNSNGFPANNGGLNGNFNNFPANNGGLNGNFNSFPVNNGGSNGNLNGFPANNGGSNGNFNGFPANNGGLNGNLNGFPANNGGSNGNLNGFPANSGGSNGNLNGFPANNGG